MKSGGVDSRGVMSSLGSKKLIEKELVSDLMFNRVLLYLSFYPLGQAEVV